VEIVSHLIPTVGRASEPMLLMPVGDIQWIGNPKGVALKMLQRHIEWGVAHNAYFIGMGDYIDTFSPSNRQRLNSAALYDSALEHLDNAAEALVEDIFQKALAPSKGRWLGLLEGHHYHKFRDGTTTDQLLADKLGAPFLGTSAYVRLLFQRSGPKGTRGSVLIWCHHGVGGGITVGAPLNKLAHVVRGFEADIYLMGHFTSKDGKPLDRIEPVYPHKAPPRLVHRTKLMVCTGGFMKSYVPNSMDGRTPRGNYVEQKMLMPASLGGPLVRISPRWRQEDGAELWLPDLSVEL